VNCSTLPIAFAVLTIICSDRLKVE
jgi:hypothetical protein